MCVWIGHFIRGRAFLVLILVSAQIPLIGNCWVGGQVFIYTDKAALSYYECMLKGCWLGRTYCIVRVVALCLAKAIKALCLIADSTRHFVNLNASALTALDQHPPFSDSVTHGQVVA